MLAADPDTTSAERRTPFALLVVDDDPSVVNLLRENFLEEGYRVICGYDGQMAIQLARQYRPDLLVMDVSMPMTNGLKAFEYLRASRETSSIPVIFVSGEHSSAIYPIVANAQRVAHLKKPIDLESLNSMVRQFLEKYPVHAPTPAPLPFASLI